MKIELEQTDRIIEVASRGGVTIEARVWEGKTSSGIPVVAFITMVSPQTHDAEVDAQFASELQEKTKATIEPFAHGIDLRFFID